VLTQDELVHYSRAEELLRNVEQQIAQTQKHLQAHVDQLITEKELEVNRHIDELVAFQTQSLSEQKNQWVTQANEKLDQIITTEKLRIDSFLKEVVRRVYSNLKECLREFAQEPEFVEYLMEMLRKEIEQTDIQVTIKRTGCTNNTILTAENADQMVSVDTKKLIDEICTELDKDAEKYPQS
jgi:exonuclease VII large subunit